MNADGTNLRQLTFNETDFARPSWSPDGRSLVYDSGGDIFTYDIASGTSQPLTHDAHGEYHEYWDAQAVWSPDGGAIVYDSFREGSWNLYQLDLANGRVRALTPAGRDEQGATFTNQPGQIAYQSVTKFPRPSVSAGSRPIIRHARAYDTARFRQSLASVIRQSSSAGAGRDGHSRTRLAAASVVEWR